MSSKCALLGWVRSESRHEGLHTSRGCAVRCVCQCGVFRCLRRSAWRWCKPCKGGMRAAHKPRNLGNSQVCDCVGVTSRAGRAEADKRVGGGGAR